MVRKREGLGSWSALRGGLQGQRPPDPQRRRHMDCVCLRQQETRTGQAIADLTLSSTSSILLCSLELLQSTGRLRLGLHLPVIFSSIYLPPRASAARVAACEPLPGARALGCRLCPDEGWTPVPRVRSLVVTIYAQCPEEASAEKLPGGAGAAVVRGASFCSPSDPLGNAGRHLPEPSQPTNQRSCRTLVRWLGRDPHSEPSQSGSKAQFVPRWPVRLRQESWSRGTIAGAAPCHSS